MIDSFLLYFMGLQMIIKIPFYLGTVNILYQFKLNLAYIEKIKFVYAYIMLSRRMIFFNI